jgi:hypothetical protein
VSRPISRTLLVLSPPSPRSLTSSVTHASALTRRCPLSPPLLAKLAWPGPRLVFSRFVFIFFLSDLRIFQALCENNRMNLFSEVAEVYARILQAEAGEVPVEIASAIELTSEQVRFFYKPQNLMFTCALEIRSRRSRRLHARKPDSRHLLHCR